MIRSPRFRLSCLVIRDYCEQGRGEVPPYGHLSGLPGHCHPDNILLVAERESVAPVEGVLFSDLSQPGSAEG